MPVREFQTRIRTYEGRLRLLAYTNLISPRQFSWRIVRPVNGRFHYEIAATDPNEGVRSDNMKKRHVGFHEGPARGR